MNFFARLNHRESFEHVKRSVIKTFEYLKSIVENILKFRCHCNTRLIISIKCDRFKYCSMKNEECNLLYFSTCVPSQKIMFMFGEDFKFFVAL